MNNQLSPNSYYYAPKVKPKQRKVKFRSTRKQLIFKFFRSVRDFVKSYFYNSGIHGFSYLVKSQLTWFENIFWLILIVLSLALCVIIGLQSVDRYYTKSTVVGMERDYYFWNTTLPSLTVCPMQRLSESRLEEYCRVHNIDGLRKDEFKHFMENLANSTYSNFNNIPDYNSIDMTLDELNIKPEDYIELIYNLTYDNTYAPNDDLRIRSVVDNSYIHVRQVLTEYGLCYMTNNYLGEEYSSKYLIFGQYPELNTFEREKRLYNILTGTFFFKSVVYTIKGFTNDAIDLFIHSAHDIMKVDSNFGYTADSVEFDPESMEITTENNFEDSATVSQRKCRFHHESNLTHFPVYTKNICRQECRLNLAVELCKCIPHFYPNRIADPKPVCSYKTLKQCFPQHEHYLLKLYRGNDNDEETATCYCQQNCRDAIVTIQKTYVMKSTSYLMRGIGGTISMKNWPRQRLKRQVIYSFTDLLVSIGGTAGLFLGFSVLGAVEFIYFFTLRLICHVRGYKI